MAATGKTPILLYGSTTASNVPSAGNLTNSSDGCEIAINVADKNLFFKDSTNAVNTVPIRQSSASSNGWLSSTDWSTFNGKAPAFTYTSGYIPYGQGTTTPTQSSSLTFNGTTLATNSFTATGTSLVGYDGGQYTNQLGVSSLVPYLAQYKWTGSGSNYYATKVINNDGVWTLQTAAAAAVGSHSFSTVFQVAQSGGVSIGNTTDPGATNLSVTGQIRLNTSTQVAVGLQSVAFNGTTTQAFASNDTSGSAGSQHLRFLSNGTAAGYISTTGATTAYVSISDYRVKDNPQPLQNSLERVMRLKPCQWLSKLDGSVGIGFIAHELQEERPQAVIGNKDDVNEDGTPHYQGVDTSFLVADLTAALQELNNIVIGLQDRLNKLENTNVAN